MMMMMMMFRAWMGGTWRCRSGSGLGGVGGGSTGSGVLGVLGGRAAHLRSFFLSWRIGVRVFSQLQGVCASSLRLELPDGFLARRHLLVGRMDAPSEPRACSAWDDSPPSAVRRLLWHLARCGFTRLERQGGQDPITVWWETGVCTSRGGDSSSRWRPHGRTMPREDAHAEEEDEDVKIRVSALCGCV